MPTTRTSEPLRILIAHEQHLQAMGSDVRLLGIVDRLRQAGHEVSLFFRAHTDNALRVPPSAALATRIGVRRVYSEAALRSDVRHLPPPALYEFVDAAQLAQLFSQGWFNVVICFFWFWLDPKPNVAEILLPYVHAYAPLQRRPLVAILSDDAHALRDRRLAMWEADPRLSATYARRAALHLERQRRSYAFADLLLYITKADAAAEAAEFPFLTPSRVGLLRLSPRDLAAASPASAGPAEVRGRAALLPPVVGFLGQGDTPTNYLAVQWFLRQCWPRLRARQPSLRLRLLGQPPGFKRNSSAEASCERALQRCGWAWGTPYDGQEAASGIDVLGFVDDLEQEVRSWRAMVVPVLYTTGINTKVYTALRLGVPVVITPAAAAPFEFPAPTSIPTDPGAVALEAESPMAFAAAVERVVVNDEERARLAAASLKHWDRLLRIDQAAADVAHFAQRCLHAFRATGFMPSAKLSPLMLVRNASAAAVEPAAAAPAGGRCFGPDGTDGPPALVVVGAHVLSFGNHSVHKRLVPLVWQVVCAACALRCVAPPMGAAALTLPTGTQLAVASLSRRQVLDLGVEVDAAGGGAKASAALRGDAVRWAHFTVDLGGAQPSAETPGLAATRLMLAGKNASAANRTALALPPITTAWQDRALWRQAFRHVGIANSALPAVWKALARELPSLFRRGGSGNQSS